MSSYDGGITMTTKAAHANDTAISIRVFGGAGVLAGDEPVSIVNVRVTAIGKLAELELRARPAGAAGVADASARDAYFRPGGMQRTQVLRRERLTAGTRWEGPVIIESMDATIVVPPRWRAAVDERGFVVSSELVLIATVMVIGLLVGMVTLRDQVTQELADVADAISELTQSYTFNSITGHHDAFVAGSFFDDTTDSCDDDGNRNTLPDTEPQCIDISATPDSETDNGP